MIAALSHRRRGHAKTLRRFFRRDQAHCPHHSSALPAQPATRSPGFSFGEFARRPRVRIDERREVNQMLKLFTFAQVAADSLRKREEGQTMAEYGVVLAVITLAVIGAITLLSDNVRSAIESVANILPG
jgi:Flp pilus assembly pilin Flp